MTNYSKVTPRCSPNSHFNGGIAMDYKYAIYFTWNDGTQDSFNVSCAKERDADIREMRNRKDFRYIGWCRIYASGEYGRITDVVGDYRTDY